MPVILHPENYDEWLLREGPSPVHLLQPFPAQQMAVRLVSKDVGNVRHKYEAIIHSRENLVFPQNSRAESA